MLPWWWTAWQGLGLLVPVIVFGCALGSEIWTEKIFENDQYYQAHGWPKLAAFIVAAGIIWLLGRVANRGCRPAGLDSRHPDIHLPIAYHTLLGFRMEYWAFPCLALGVFVFFVGGDP